LPFAGYRAQGSRSEAEMNLGVQGYFSSNPPHFIKRLLNDRNTGFILTPEHRIYPVGPPDSS
ncbi:MAG: hypothetical protein PHG32_08400, partial [Candidatus Cloacimonetes bacterium]|nr:hypothetical protein [Candidatus Cloacimonadota bacterium]